MSKLIEELKSEHQLIAGMLNRVRELGIGSQEGRNLLVSAKEGLLAHLQKEDKQLYPVLRDKAQNDPALQRTMESFARDMETISAAAMEFFNKYAAGGTGVEFARDFGRLFVILGGRIQKEENILYKAYEKAVS